MPEQDTDNDNPVPPELIDELLASSGDRELLGEGGLLQQLTKQLLETAPVGDGRGYVTNGDGDAIVDPWSA